MYTYSPIKNMRVRNFRNIGEAELDFSESPLVTLIGDNESGKTSIVKAFGVCALNANPRDQKDYIRTGTQGFGVQITLEDGTEITRIKASNQNRYNIQKNGETIWDAVKLENEVPKAVSDVMGLIEEPETKEFLQIRTYEDQLLFVVTPASTNYKVMYDALKISQLTRAIKSGSTEANELKAQINYSENSIYTLQSSLSAIKVFDIEPLLNVRAYLARELDKLDKIDKIISVMNEIESLKQSLGSLRLIEESNITSIDIGEASKIIDISRLLEKVDCDNRLYSVYNQLSTVEFIDTTELSKIDNIMSKISLLEGMKISSGLMSELSKAEVVSEIEISSLNRANSLLNAINNDSERLKIYNVSEAENIAEKDLDILSKMSRVTEINSYIETSDKSLVQIKEYIDGVVNWMKSVGVSTVDCPKCNETIIIDLGMLDTSNGG